ncbi:Hypothetical predicted protein [Lecanosticta acicola]|uniref:Uncharacterized protein n=1 Tax=Lecanosticta acicola TaxID=111012 RepID=A0AAI8YSM5_9PEZI|nr:Hypothetical predicted protein [Lecanosticta acicola]
MGTRHLICIYYNGRFVVAQYGQWDGNPEVQGVKVLKFLREPGNLERLKKGIEHIEEVKSDEEIRAFGSHEALSRDTSAKVLEIIAEATPETKVLIFKDLEFVNNTVLCEWAYVVDLDQEVFEVFEGYEGSRSKGERAQSNRFQDVGPLEAEVPILVSSFSFDSLADLPSDGDFVEKVDLRRKVLGLKYDSDECE